MNRRAALILRTMALLCLAVALPAGNAAAQEKQHVSFKTPVENSKYVQQLNVDVRDAPNHILRIFEIHYTYPNLSLYLSHMNRYSSLGAQLARAKGYRSFSFSNIVLRPLATFIYNYFIRLGFLDGREGLLLHLYHAGYVSWKYAKAWELERNNASGSN